MSKLFLVVLALIIAPIKFVVELTKFVFEYIIDTINVIYEMIVCTKDDVQNLDVV